jgi:EAL and modified HD-GYP domain-containing signal transduction protein
MANQAAVAKIPEAAPPELESPLRYVARQPILDIRGKVHGYELLFRAGPETVFRGDGDAATRTMLDNTVIFGLELLTGGLPAFVNCTAEALTAQLVDVLPAGMTVLEVLESLEPTPELIDACKKLKASGFRLALDDFVYRPEFEPLLELADYVKIDYMQTNAAERKLLLKQLKRYTVALVAEKIETQEDYKVACAEGFTLFQGYFFCRPILLQNRKVPANRLFHLEIIHLLQSPALNFRQLSNLVKRDAALTYRLLRLVNSPMCAMRQEVKSIEMALTVVGEEAFRRMATLAIASELNGDQPTEILRMAFVRARFCEMAASLCSLIATEQYLLGLFSLLPAMLRVRMEELARMLPLREEISSALLGKESVERSLLHWVESYERGEWATCDEISAANNLNQGWIAECYIESLAWAEEALKSAK